MGTKTLCDIHGEIQKLVNEILKVRENDYEEIRDLLYEMQYIAYEIYNLSEESLYKGQSMEDRLIAYRKAIEGLGFIRDK